jgi:SAM-dependent methyltransferase
MRSAHLLRAGSRLAASPLLAQRVRLPIAALAGARAAAPLSARATLDAVEDIDIDSVSYGFMASQAIFTGLEVGLFDAIAAAGDGGIGLAGLQATCGVSAPRLQTLITSLVALKSLHRATDGRYTLSPNTASFLVSSAKYYYGDYLRYQMGRQFYHRMGALPDVMTTGVAPSYASWFSDPEVAATYTRAQHNGSVATAKSLVKRLSFEGVSKMLDVGGGSGAFSYVFCERNAGLSSQVLELPEVCATGNGIKAEQKQIVQEAVSFVELDATSPDWPVQDAAFDMVLMSYISGSVPEPIIGALYANACKALKPGGRLIVHDFMVNDSLDGPSLGALWALQHVTVNADGLGLCPKEIIDRMGAAGFDASKCETMEMIHGMTKVVIARK